MGVAESWARVVGWCEGHAPATAEAIRPPAGISALREAEASTGGSWPDDLRTWYALADGTERTPAGYVLPFYCPLPLSAVISHWSMWQEAMAFIAGSSRDQDADQRLRALGGTPEEMVDVIARLESQPAGSAAGWFLPAFVPIAEDQSSSDMFVDTRPGPLGCVTEYVKGNADSGGPVWLSVSAMLADLAEGLWAGGRVGRWGRPIVTDRELDWELVGLDGGRPSLGDGLSLPPG
jgi:cell wall assembly regulator SMI1